MAQARARLGARAVFSASSSVLVAQPCPGLAADELEHQVARHANVVINFLVTPIPLIVHDEAEKHSQLGPPAFGGTYCRRLNEFGLKAT